MADTVTTLAIVLNSHPYRDNDRMVTLLSPELGKISALARGARKPGAKLSAASEPLFCGDYSFNRSGGRLYMAQALSRMTFFGLSADYDAYMAAMLFLETAGIFAAEPDPVLFSLLANCLSKLETGIPPRPVLLYYLVKLCQISGLLFEVRRCVSCGKKTLDNFLISMGEGGVLCPKCAANAADAAKVPPSFLVAADKISRTSPQNAPVEMSGADVNFGLDFMPKYIESVCQVTLKCAKFIK